MVYPDSLMIGSFNCEGEHMDEKFDVRAYLEISGKRPLELRVCHISALWYGKVLGTSAGKNQLDTMYNLFPELIIKRIPGDGKTKVLPQVNYNAGYITAYEYKGSLYQGSTSDAVDIVRGLFGSISKSKFPRPTNDIQKSSSEVLCTDTSLITGLRDYYKGLIMSLSSDQLECFKTVFKAYINTVIDDYGKYKGYKTSLFPFESENRVIELNNYLSQDFGLGNYSDFFLWMNLGALLRNEIIQLLNTFDSSFDLRKKEAEALDTEEIFIQRIAGKLSGRLNMEEKIVPAQGTFVSNHPDRFFGREEKLEQVLGWIGKEKVILVSGEGGIGKTEFCREVLARAKESGMNYKAVSLIECRTFDDMIRRVAGRYGIALGPEDKTEQIEQVVLDELNGILYLDNFEDLISDRNTAPEQQKQAVSFLRKCRSIDNVTVLISSRYKLDVDFFLEEAELDVLDEDAAVRLFNWLWAGDDSLPEDDNIRDFVINDLHRYPLSIVLTAKQGGTCSIERLRRKWRTRWSEVSVRFPENDRHHSLETALHMTYMEIKDRESERALWELFTLFPDQIEDSAAEELVDDFDDALKSLVNIGIVHLDNAYLSVQPTLREYIKETEEYPDDIRKLSGRLLKYYTVIYGEDGKRNWGTEQDFYASERLADTLFFMNWLADEEHVEAIGTLHYSICSYYQDAPYEAIIPVEKALNIPGMREDHLKANMLEYCGDLEMRTDKLKEAAGHYEEAEVLYRRIHDDLGLANVLRALGDLEMRTDKLTEAACHYEEAEVLYRRIHADLGLANVLQSMGDFFQNKEDYSKAAAIYADAISLYSKTEELMGLTYTASEICFCYAKTGDTDLAMNYVEMVSELCEKLPYEDVKKYCISKIMAALMILLGEQVDE